MSATKGLRLTNLVRPIIIAMVALLAAIIILAPSVNFGNLFNSSTSTSINCDSILKSGNSAPGQVNSPPNASSVSMVIIESDPGNLYEGMNGSAYHITDQWPVITVHQGQSVTIHVVNCASSEPHGFSITHYFDSGVSLSPGQSYTLTFTATQKGTFRVFCNIFCIIHPDMQNGALIVE